VTIHYHGTPITPRSVLYELAGRNFCVSFSDPRDVEVCHQIGQSVMLDNGAFSVWRRGERPDWGGYYRWCERWLEYPTTWAVIPDTINGSLVENVRLIREWPFPKRMAAPVWHMHEPIGWLIELVRDWTRVCIGSSAQYATVGDARWHARMTEVFNSLAGAHCWFHMLRGMSLAGSHYPFASVDSTDIARNHNRPQNTAEAMAKRWDSLQCPPRWIKRAQQEALFA
jgi:hypothetical protein